MGTGNRDEDGYLGYFCKAGDGVVDVQLISDLHKSEVFKVGAELGVPESILQSPPSADLWDGQTDEEELGVSYDFVELYTGWYLKQSEEKQKAFVNSMDEETMKEWIHYRDICENVHRRNAHKLNGPMNLNVLWIVCNKQKRNYFPEFIITMRRIMTIMIPAITPYNFSFFFNSSHFSFLASERNNYISHKSLSHTSAVSAKASVLSTMISSFSPRSIILSTAHMNKTLQPMLSIITPFTASNFCCTRVAASAFGSFHFVIN